MPGNDPGGFIVTILLGHRRRAGRRVARTGDGLLRSRSGGRLHHVDSRRDHPAGALPMMAPSAAREQLHGHRRRRCRRRVPIFQVDRHDASSIGCAWRLDARSCWQPPPASQSPTVDEIVAKNLAAKGGVEKLRAVTSVKMTGRIKTSRRRMPVVNWAKRPNKMRRENISDGQTFVRRLRRQDRLANQSADRPEGARDHRAAGGQDPPGRRRLRHAAARLQSQGHHGRARRHGAPCRASRGHRLSVTKKNGVDPGGLPQRRNHARSADRHENGAGRDERRS